MSITERELRDRFRVWGVDAPTDWQMAMAARAAQVELTEGYGIVLQVAPTMWEDRSILQGIAAIGCDRWHEQVFDSGRTVAPGPLRVQYLQAAEEMGVTIDVDGEDFYVPDGGVIRITGLVEAE